MANKTSANQGSSGEQERGTPRVSRKVLGKTSAAYERKAGAEGGEEKKPGGEGEQAAGDQGAQAEGQPAPDVTAAGAEAAPDQARNEAARPTRKESGARREARTTSEQTPAAPAGEPAAAAPRAEMAAPAPASTPASTPPGAEAPPAPAAAPSAEQPPVPKPDPAAEFEVLLKPREIQRWDPSTPAAPPTKAPPGDSRSFRRRGEDGEEFVLIYRTSTFLIRRAGRVGVMGTWTVTEYPHIGSAAHAYAQQCSDLVHAGFRDLR